VRVNLVVVGDPRWQLVHHGLGIRTRTEADVTRLIVPTKASAIPLLCGLSIGVVLGSRPIARANEPAYKQQTAVDATGGVHDSNTLSALDEVPHVTGRSITIATTA
jgi:hypothetical protein